MASSPRTCRRLRPGQDNSTTNRACRCAQGRPKRVAAANEEMVASLVKQGGLTSIAPYKGEWVYLYRAVDSAGQTIDFLLSAKRDAVATKRFFRKALRQPHTVNPRTITVDKNAAYPIATKAMKREGTLRRFAKVRQVKFLNHIVEQDHRRIKRLVRSGLGFKSFVTATQTIAGYEVMAMIRKGQVGSAPAIDMGAQRDFIATLFGAAACLSSCPAFA